MAVHHLASTLTCHAWNADRTKTFTIVNDYRLCAVVAVCPNSADVYIYTGCTDADTMKWERKWTLKQHDMTVSGIDWHPVTNRIVTVAHDRNAFVWNFDRKTDTWEPTVCILGIDRAALDVKWSPDGKKFAVASGNKNAIVCWYDTVNNWWVGKPCKREKAKATAHSSVVAVSWHPNSQIIAVASTDYRARVLFTYLDTEDDTPDGAQFGPGFSFGDVIADFEVTRAWVNDIAWSPSGAQLAFIMHDGLVNIVPEPAKTTESGPHIVTLKATGLPAAKMLWLSDKALVTAGHNMNPDLFSCASGTWKSVTALDVKGGAHAARASKSFDNAKALFAKSTKGAGSEAEDTSAGSWTKHQGAISYIQPMKSSGKAINVFSTSGNDGRIVVWDMSSMSHVPKDCF